MYVIVFLGGCNRSVRTLSIGSDSRISCSQVLHQNQGISGLVALETCRHRASALAEGFAEECR